MPEDGIKINEDNSIKFTTFEKLFSKNPEKKNIEDIIDVKDDNALDTVKGEEKIIINDDNTVDTVRVIADSLINVVEKFQFANGDASVLYGLFDELIKLGAGGQVRMIHYGDSQIEGDRITGFLRNRFQAMYGGSGPGMVPAVPANNISLSILQSHSDEWKRHTVFGKRDTTLGHKRFGSLGAFGRYAPYPAKLDTTLPDSLQPTIDTTTIYEGWLKFEKSSSTYASNRNISKVKMFYGYNENPVIAELYSGEDLIGMKSLHSNSSLNQVTWDVPKDAQEFTIKFSGKDSPDVYGVSFEGPGGIAMDNVPMRGSSGTDFTRMDLTFLANMYRKLNVKLLILEFGVNVVPGELENYNFYERWLVEQLKALKRINPGMAIIVIGVSDMAKKTDDYYESYSNIPLIRDAMRNAAFKTGCAFWDMYEAMGGENSMPAWVFADPPLAAKDFTHFNHKGARIIARMFYNAFIYEYNKYLKKKTE